MSELEAVLEVSGLPQGLGVTQSCCLEGEERLCSATMACVKPTLPWEHRHGWPRSCRQCPSISVCLLPVSECVLPASLRSCVGCLGCKCCLSDVHLQKCLILLVGVCTVQACVCRVWGLCVVGQQNHAQCFAQEPTSILPLFWQVLPGIGIWLYSRLYHLCCCTVFCRAQSITRDKAARAVTAEDTLYCKLVPHIAELQLFY